MSRASGGAVEESRLADSMSQLLNAHVRDGKYDPRGLVATAAADGWLDLMAMALGPNPDVELEDALRACEVWGETCAPLELVVNGAFVAPLATHLPTSAFRSTLTEHIAAGATFAIPVPRDNKSAPSLGPATCRLDTTGPIPHVNGKVCGLTSAVADKFLIVAEEGGVDHLVMAEGADGLTRVEQVGTIASGLSVADIELDEVQPLAFIEVSLEVRKALHDSTAAWLIALNAMAVGICEEMVRRTAAFTRERVQFGRAISSFQAVRHLVADMQIATESGRCLAERAAQSWVRSTSGAAEELAAARLYLADKAVEVCESAIQLHGGAGFTWELGLHHHYRWALLAQTYLTDVDGIRAHLASEIIGDLASRREGVAS